MLPRFGYSLLTGATGLVGSVLLRDLLRRGERVAVLVRPSRLQSGAERIESSLQHWESLGGDPIPRPVCLSGDVNAPDLGLDADAQQWVARHCTRVIHNAAIVKFTAAGRDSEIWRTNLGGTRNTLELCRTLGVREFHYMSTAYVCGRRQGVIRESELEMGQEFRNDYEHSKCLAEVLIRAADFIAPPTIYRPAVISGDSETGFTNTFHGINAYMRLLHVLLTNTQPDSVGRRFAPLRIALDGNEPRNVVPVDWVSATVCDLLDNPACRGRTFHLAPQIPLTPASFFAAAYSYFNAYGYEFCGRGWEIDANPTRFEQAFLEHRTPYEDYEHSDPQFETTNLNRYARSSPCPSINEEVMHRYFRFGTQDRWGKRPPRSRRVDVWAEDLLRQSIEGFGHQWSHRMLPESTLGLNVVGPGGGQWRVDFDSCQVPTVRPGLPRGSQPVVRLSVNKLARLLGRSRKTERQRETFREECSAAFQVRRSRRLLRGLAAALDSDRFARHAMPLRAG